MDKLPTHPPTVSAAAFRQWLGGRKRILVLTHERPDGDAFGALCAACAVLGRAGLDVVGYLKDPPARRYAFLPVPAQLRTAADFPSANPQLTTHNPQPALKEDAKTQRTPLLCASEPSVQSSVSPDFDGVFCLDCARAERLELPPGWDLARLHALPVLNLDHHADNPGFGAVNLVDSGMAATCQFLLDLFTANAMAIPPDAAAWLLTGLFMDTGAFRFTNTSPAVLRAAARLMELGADYAKVMDGLFFHEPYSRRRLAARLLETAEFHFGGRLLLTRLPPAWLTEFETAPADTEGLIDTLRVVDGVLITALLQPEPNRVRVSLRSRGDAWPVDGLAHALGGGGHRLAAGIKLDGMTLDQAREAVLRGAAAVLGTDDPISVRE